MDKWQKNNKILIFVAYLVLMIFAEKQVQKHDYLCHNLLGHWQKSLDMAWVHLSKWDFFGHFIV